MAQARPVLLCFDGSPYAERAISAAGELFPERLALVLTVWQPIGQFGPRDPLGAYLEALSPSAHELDEIAATAAMEQAEHGAQLARAAGLEAEALAESGEHIPSRIVDLAGTHDVAAVVVGSRGLSGVRSVLLGGVSNTVVHECPRPVLVVRDDDAPCGVARPCSQRRPSPPTRR